MTDEPTIPNDESLERIRSQAAERQAALQADDPVAPARRGSRKRETSPDPKYLVPKNLDAKGAPVQPTAPPTLAPVGDDPVAGVDDPAEVTVGADSIAVSAIAEAAAREPASTLSQSESPETARVASPAAVETAPIQNQTTPTSGYWEPGPRLNARVDSDSAPVMRAAGSDRGRWIALAILAVALLVAIGLYVLANVLVEDEDVAPGVVVQTEQPE